ncbi:hypothetical protein [Streptococcus ruminantium]|uniref:Uncharacterized protein n=1 Tax=Streptococcus ruminantium TaxID=1917441 RepID=A0ABU1B504_9STRE|nr:hypothetical protein [Streptococcus ruminantium]MDQ8759085.1 hypothetical protein [Streptococcus ruminantium]MDQ8769641.1 hypothetical protein [Streptococcus ruminantium]MDQ8775537.1 hypothetical protein [Streptococcus ruminantium]MDQ8794446.1 hypothetical protein [Streptococcus ruminantium]MDQ8796681.1 hypothetical protein [Streptococcus ruminantium]
MSVKGIGLDLGERMVIGRGKYEILNHVVDVEKSLGKIQFLSIGDPVIDTEDVEENGRTVQKPTGEILGYVVNYVYAGGEADSVTIVGMSRSDIESLGLKVAEEIELVTPVLTISRMPRNNSQLKVFADGLKKAVAKEPVSHVNPENKKDKN